MSSTMKVKELSTVLHIPKKLNTIMQNGKEIAQQLPMCNPVESYVVDEYPACPQMWVNGSSLASSYFLPVEEGRGLWLDFNGCWDSEYDVAIVVSVQGVNPLTGQKTDELRLEQYKDKCPIHNVLFKQDRFCPECKFKWPAQNYITTTSTPEGYLWIDGFRNPNGTVRQYVFTPEKLKQGVAEQLIGVSKVFAIGIAFYLSKKKKEKRESNSDIVKILKALKDDPPSSDIYTLPLSFSSQVAGNFHTRKYLSTSNSNLGKRQIGSFDDTGMSLCYNNKGENIELTASDMVNSVSGSIEYVSDTNEQIPDQVDELVVIDEPMVVDEFMIEEVTPVTKLDVAAGALIKQRIHEDPKDIDYWEGKPFGMIYINYCDLETAEKIISQGKRQEKKNGFLQDITLAD